jgi:DNA polymerase V
MGKAALMAPVLSLPFYVTRIPAGFPSPADDFIEDRIDLNQLLVKQPDATYFVKACGDSMIDAGIEDGDLLVVDSALAADPKDGWIVIAVIDGQTTLKRLRLIHGQTWLYPQNSQKNYPPLQVTAAMDFRVWGVVRAVCRQHITY